MSATVSVVAFEGELNSIVQEYLQAGNFTKSAEAFRKECDEDNKPIAELRNVARSNSAVVSVQNDMIQYFQYGNAKEFFNLWEEHVPDSVKNNESVAHKLEFYLHIYFAIFPIKHGAGAGDVKTATDLAMAQFKTYLETRGSSLSQTTEFLPYYALPFVPNPRAHPSYKELFSDSWVPDLQQRIEKFLTLALHSQPQPKLFDLYRNSPMSSPSKETLEQMERMQQQVIEADRRCATYVRRYTRMQADYHNLIGVSADLVDMLEQLVQGKQMSPDHMNRVLTKLFTQHMRDSRQSIDLTRPGTAAKALRASIAMPPGKLEENLLASLDYDKIKEDLGQLSDRKKSFLLQALRWRLTRSVPGEQRDAVIAAYTDQDLLACAAPGPYRKVVLGLLSSHDETVRQYSARLFNGFASLCEGRSYLCQNRDLLGGLMVTLKADDNDSITRENVLGALQKLSLRRSMQTAMIEEGIVQWLVGVLDDNDNLSDYTLEYSVALLMNLCLRTTGKMECAKDPHRVLEVLSNMLGHENQEILPYVNGALYSILGIPAVREEAKAMDMEAILKCFIKPETPDMNRQLEFIIKQLNATENSAEIESDDEEDEDEDEEDQDAMEADLDKAEAIKPQPGELFGEKLLNTEYLGIMTNIVNGKKRNKLLDAAKGGPMQRPTTPGHLKNSVAQSLSELSMQQPSSPTRFGTSRAESRPFSNASRPVTSERPPTRSGSRGNSRPTTAEQEHITQYDLDDEGSGVISMATGIDRKLAAPDSVSRPSQKSMSAVGGKASNKEYSAAFSTRSKMARTPDTSEGRPSAGSNRQTPQPKYSASLPRPSTQERGQSSRNSQGNVSGGNSSKPASGSRSNTGARHSARSSGKPK